MLSLRYNNMEVSDLIKVTISLVRTPEIPDRLHMSLFVGSKKAGLPDKFGDGEELVRTAVVNSLDAAVELGILPTSEVYKMLNIWFSNGGQQATLGIVKTEEVEGVEVEETFTEALNAIREQNNVFYSVIPAFANNEDKANIKTACLEIAAWCSSRTNFASFIMRDADDFDGSVSDDLGSALKALNYDCCMVVADLENKNNVYALNTCNVAQAIMHQRGQYDLSWKGDDWQGVETTKYTIAQRQALDNKNVSYYFIDENGNRNYFMGKTPSGLPACVKIDIDYAKMLLENSFYRLFKTNGKIPNNINSQLTIESTIKRVVKQLQQEGVFEPLTKQEVADRFFGGITSNVVGYDPNYGCALYMPDITKPENTPNGIYKGIILYVKINGVVYGVHLDVVGSL